ncbi:MAG: cytoskeletal protein binding protein [Watsoniomyces obsoletus]|nr:MAG: cytoskeletal protein binding protein [Watsoniomyces obsoletus]
MYGMYHQSTLTARQKMAEINREYSRKESLIEQAKREYIKRTTPPEKRTESGLVTDPMDARFDLEAYLNSKFADTAG